MVCWDLFKTLQIQDISEVSLWREKYECALTKSCGRGTSRNANSLGKSEWMHEVGGVQLQVPANPTQDLLSHKTQCPGHSGKSYSLARAPAPLFCSSPLQSLLWPEFDLSFPDGCKMMASSFLVCVWEERERNLCSNCETKCLPFSHFRSCTPS